MATMVKSAAWEMASHALDLIDTDRKNELKPAEQKPRLRGFTLSQEQCFHIEKEYANSLRTSGSLS
jgi:hypothetical protein